MKKTLLFIFSLFVATMAMAHTEYTWTWENWAGITKTGMNKNGTPKLTSADEITFTKDGFSIVANKAGASNASTVNATDKDFRAYAKSTVTIKNTTKMSGLQFNISSQGKKRLAEVTASAGKVIVNPSTWIVTWTGDAEEVTFTVGDNATYGTEGATKHGQLCFDKVGVYTNGEVPNAGEIVDLTNTPETAYTVAKAIELITAGAGLDKEVYVKGTIINIESINTTQYGNATYNIADAGTKEPLLKVFRGFYYLGDKFTSETQIQDGDEVVVYGKLKDHKGTKEVDMGNKIYSINGKTASDIEPPYTVVGDGTLANAYTAADVIYLFKHDKAPAGNVWVKGEILGNVVVTSGATVVPTVFTDVNKDGKIDDKDAGEGETVASASNISLGDPNDHISVQFTFNTAPRKEINILDHKENIGKKVWLYGKIEKYCSIPGLKGVTEFSWDGVATGINNVNAAAHNDALYNVAGQRVSDSFKGIVIKNGRKYIK